MKVKYILGAILSLPFLPVLFYQGKKVRSAIPRLPGARGTVGCSESSEADDQLHLVTIGESTVAGVGVDTHDEGLTGSMAREISTRINKQVCWTVYARSGFTAKDVREKLVPKIYGDKIDLIVIGIGANDAFRLHTPYRWRKDLNDLIADLRSRFSETPVVFINLPPVKDFPAFTPLMKTIIGNLVDMLGEELKDIVSEYEDVYFLEEKIRLKDWLQRSGDGAKVEDFFSDGVHPSKLTYQLWAKDIARNLQDVNILKLALNQD